MTVNKRIAIAVAVVVVVIVATLIWLSTRLGISPLQIAGLVSSGGDRELRDPMRTPREGTKVLLIALDGIGHDVLQEALQGNRMPHLSQLLGSYEGEVFEHGALARGISVLPSTTMAAWASIYTGEPPAQTGVPGNEWFAREEGLFYAPAPVSASEYTHTMEMLTDDLMGSVIAVPTLYERLDRRAFVALAPVYRGADLFVTPAPETVGAMFLRTVEGISAGDIEREVYSEVDEETAENLLEGIDEHGVPDLQVVYFPGVDLHTHVAEEDPDSELSYLQEVIDMEIGTILNSYREHGVLDDTVVMLVSDHGHIPVLGDDRHALSWDGENEPPALLEQTGFRVRPASLPLAKEGERQDPEEHDYQAVFAYQGAMAYIYLADRSTCVEPGSRCDWSKPPRLEEDVMPVVRAFEQASDNGAGVPALQGTLDMVLAREPRPTDVDALPFEIYQDGALRPIGDYLAENPRPDLLRFEERMSWLAEGPFGHRAGDVLLLTRSGQDRPIEERYYFSHEYRSWHGSPAAQDSYIPLLVIQGSRSGAQIRAQMQESLPDDFSQLDIVPFLLDIFSGSEER